MRFIRLATMAIALCTAPPAAAQTFSRIPCWQPSVGIALGPMTNGDRNGAEGDYPMNHAGAALSVNGSVETPVVNEWAARLDAGVAEWPFVEYDFRGVERMRERVRVKRLTASAVKVVSPPGQSCNPWVRLFAGGGAGVYRYEYESGGARSRFGLHVVAGVDVTVSRRITITAVGSMHAADGPDRAPVFSNTFFAAQGSIGIKWAL